MEEWWEMEEEWWNEGWRMKEKRKKGGGGGSDWMFESGWSKETFFLWMVEPNIKIKKIRVYANRIV